MNQMHSRSVCSARCLPSPAQHRTYIRCPGHTETCAGHTAHIFVQCTSCSPRFAAAPRRKPSSRCSRRIALCASMLHELVYEVGPSRHAVVLPVGQIRLYGLRMKSNNKERHVWRLTCIGYLADRCASKHAQELAVRSCSDVAPVLLRVHHQQSCDLQHKRA